MNILGLPTIDNVQCFVEVPENRSWMIKLGDKYTWAQQNDFIITADQKLELGGELVEFLKRHGVEWIPLNAGTGTNSSEFLSEKSQTGLFQAWSEPTQSGCRYTILVDYRDHSKTIESNAALKVKVFDIYRNEVTRCVFSGNDPDLNKILSSVMFQCGIPYKGMGFLVEHIQTVTKTTPDNKQI